MTLALGAFGQRGGLFSETAKIRYILAFAQMGVLFNLVEYEAFEKMSSLTSFTESRHVSCVWADCNAAKRVGLRELRLKIDRWQCT